MKGEPVAERAGSPATVIIKGVDAGDTYLYWRWLHALDEPDYAVLQRASLDQVMTALDEGLPNARPGEAGSEALVRAFDGFLMDRHSEWSFFRDAANVVLPRRLVDQILDHVNSLPLARPVLRVSPPPSLARLPWELLVVDESGTRLLEVADVRLDVSVTVAFQRDNFYRGAESGMGRPPHWAEDDYRNRAVLYVLDPATGDPPVLETLPGTSSLARHLSDQIASGRALGGTGEPARYFDDLIYQSVSRVHLADALRSTNPPGRLMYFGHVTSADPASHKSEDAAMHLTDKFDSYGQAALARGRDGVLFRPFTALDLVAGTSMADDDGVARGAIVDESRLQLSPDRVPGNRIWPMPLRVALIACDSGSDQQFAEPFGLVNAMILNGAEVVTATRWVLPTDHGFATNFGHDRRLSGQTPTSDLVAAVDLAHDADDPIAALQDWERGRLDAWRAGGNPVDTPLIWASVATHYSPELTLDQVRSGTPG